MWRKKLNNFESEAKKSSKSGTKREGFDERNPLVSPIEIG